MSSIYLPFKILTSPHHLDARYVILDTIYLCTKDTSDIGHLSLLI